MAHVSTLRLLTARPEAACPTPVPMDDVDWGNGRSFVTVDIDGCGSEFRVEVPHGSPMELDELFRLLDDPQPPDAEDLLMADSFLWNDVVPDSFLWNDVVPEAVPPPVLEPVPVPAPAPAAVPPPQIQRRQARPPEASSSIQQLFQLAPYVELAADSVILQQLAAAMHSRRRNAAGVVKQIGHATRKWRSRATELLATLRAAAGYSLTTISSVEWRKTCAPGLRDIVDELRGHYRGNHHLPLLIMLQRMGADDPVMPFAVWNALSEREYEPAIPDDLEAADTGYAGLGLRARSLVRRDEREDGPLLGMMASSTWPSDTPPPAEPDVYVFSAGLVSVVCPPAPVVGLQRRVSGGVWGLMNDAHGRGCTDATCTAANVEYLEAHVSRMEEYLGAGCNDARSTVIQCVLARGETVAPGSWLETHYGAGFEWPTEPDVY
jgi:hypothetical protein